MRFAILCHEFSHFYVNDNMDDESEADINGLLIYLGLGYPRIEGYQAFLDGKLIEHRASHQGLAMVAAEPGKHELELRYVGTTKLWIALSVSVLTALGWVLWWVLSRRARLQPVSM
jgi:hypothetical protein